MEQPSSNIFEGYRSVGHVTNSLPCIVRHAKNPQDTRIVTIVGRTFHTYSMNLSLLEVSIPHEYDIRTIISDELYIYSASGRVIFCWGRGSKTLINKFDNGHQADVKLLAKMGADRLVSIDDDNVLFNWDLKENEILNIVSIEKSDFEVTTLTHPRGYKNKILLGSKQGKMRLMNVCEERVLFEYPNWNSAINCIVQSPFEDVLGIGLEDGHIHIHNIRYNESILKIYQEYGPVTSMTFRLDGLPFLVTGSDNGHLLIWNLERKRLSTQIRNAHVGAISRCQFIRGCPQLVSSGSDNSIKMWTLDMSDGGGNLLSQRSGHSEPPSQIQFYGEKGFNLLSSGLDSTMKMFHLYSERLNRNLGTARLNAHKTKNKENIKINTLPPITCFACETAREKNWDNIVACHRDASLVTTWNYDKCKMGEHIIMQPTFNKHKVTANCVCITSCGNFVIIGFSNGLIFKYNIQSGIFRMTYETDTISGHRAHEDSVQSVVVDGLDLILISGGLDSKLKMWNFKSGNLLMTWDCPSPILKFKLHKDNNLLAVALDNNEVEIRDLEARTIVRQFSSNSPILDLTFSPDSRWLLVSHSDASIRTWDLSLGKLIDSFRLDKPCISMDMSATGEFLATAHADSLAINIWCNYTIYCPTTLRSIDPEQLPPLLDMPHVKCDDEKIFDDEDVDEEGEGNQKSTDIVLAKGDDPSENGGYLSADQLGESMITTSGLPASRWKNILSIEEIREKQLIEEEEQARNRRQVKVPFFIPVKDGLKPKLDDEKMKDIISEQEQESADLLASKSKITDLSLLSPIARCLLDCKSNNDYQPFITQLKELGPSAIDAEIRSLSRDICGDNVAMSCFLDAMEWKLSEAKDYELVNSWLALFLKAHADLIETDPELRSKCSQLSQTACSNWDRLTQQFDRVFCVLNFIRSSIL